MALVPAVNNRSFMDMAGQYSQGAISARSAMRPVQSKPEKTVGGAISSTAGMTLAGATLGSMFAAEGATGLAAVGGPWFLVGGAVIGLGSYLLS